MRLSLVPWETSRPLSTPVFNVGPHMKQFGPATQTPPMPRSKKGTGNFNIEDWGVKGALLTEES